LNALANHGFLPRDGKNISVFDLVSALRAGYKLSTPLAIFLALGGFFLLRRFRNLSLYEVGRHGRVEHNASLVHSDTPAGEKYAPTEIHKDLVDLLIGDAQTVVEPGEGTETREKRRLMAACDVARARIRREKESCPLDGVHAEIARGEMGIILGVMEMKAGGKAGVPIEWMREWIGEERIPAEWKPKHAQGLFDTVKRSKAIRQAMDEIRKSEEASETEQS
jgi:hypothetical protein